MNLLSIIVILSPLYDNGMLTVDILILCTHNTIDYNIPDSAMALTAAFLPIL